MPRSRLSFGRLAAIAVLILVSINHASALTMAYCSSDNTASTGKNSSIFQSNGLCYSFCLDDYAFAVLQDEGCWCSNYVPASTVSTSECSEECPGYPSDTCGGDGLYGYIGLTKAASGTQGAAATSTSITAAQKTVTSDIPAVPDTVTETPAAVTVFVTPIQSSDPETLSTLTTSTKTTSTTPTQTSTVAAESTTSTSNTKTTTSSTESTTSSTWTPTPVTSLETVTGQVRTVTVTPTQPPNSSSTAGSSKKSSGLSTGGAVGLTIGLVALVGLISGIVYFYLRRKKKDEEHEKVMNIGNEERRDSDNTNGGVPSRTMSENSRYVLATDGRGQVVEAWEAGDAGSRRSRLIPIDPRLDPHSDVYLGDNKSRESLNTIRDDRDYSRRVHQPKRVLGVTNPDHSDDD